MSSPRDVIDQVLYDHNSPADGSPNDDYLPRDEFECCTEAILTALHEAGYRIVGPLPEPVYAGGVAMWNAFPDDGADDDHCRRSYRTAIRADTEWVGVMGRLDLTPDEARHTALALLAAAEKAEEETR